MNLYILRHASAGQHKANPLLDRKRPLDKEGKQYCILLGRILSTVKLQFDCIVSSPLKRAQQTATLVGTETSYEKPVVIAPAMAPEGTWNDFQKLLDRLMKFEDVLIVGHNPNLPEFLNRLLCPNAAAPIVRLRKGAVALLDMERRPAKLQWLLDPRVIRAVQASATKSSRAKTSRK